jgi:hypothetical protein
MAVEHLLCKNKALSSNPSPTKKKKLQPRTVRNRLVPVAHSCNPRYSGGRDQEDQGSKPAWGNSSNDPISKKPITKKGLVEWLKVKALSSNLSTAKKKKKKMLRSCWPGSKVKKVFQVK